MSVWSMFVYTTDRDSVCVFVYMPHRLKDTVRLFFKYDYTYTYEFALSSICIPERKPCVSVAYVFWV